MRLLRPSEVPVAYEAAVFHYSRLRAASAALLVLGFAAVCLILGRQQFVGVAHYVSYYIGAVLLVLLFFLRGYITARFRGSNWLAQTVSTGVFVKFRSYLNYALPDSDQTVVFIPYQEIRSAGLLTKRVAFRDPQGHRTTQTRHYVEFDVAGDVSEIANAISDEQTRPSPSEKHWYGTTSTIYNHYPVQVVSPSFVQVLWTVVPGRNAFLNALRPFVEIAPPIYLTEDFDKLATLTREQQTEKLHKLDAAGQTVTAIATARRLYGYDLATAKAFVESLHKLRH